MPLLRLLAACAALLLAGCGNFLNLKQNLAEYQSHYTTVPISVRAEDCANCLLFAVIMARDEPGKVLSFRLLTQDESWRALLPKMPEACSPSAISIRTSLTARPSHTRNSPCPSA